MVETNTDTTLVAGMSDLQVKKANLFKSQSEALNDIVFSVTNIISNSSVSISSLNLAYQELKTQYDDFIDAWHQYEIHILSDTSLHESASRDFRQLKREAFKLLNEVSQLKDSKSTGVTVPVAPPVHMHSLPTPKLSPIEIPKFDGDVSKWSAF